MTVLVTGAAGFLGSHVIELLVERDDHPRALMQPGEALSGVEETEVDVRTGDLADPATIVKALEGVTRVIHCAARTDPWGPEAEYERTNVRGLETLVTAAMAAGVQRVVHVSSITVHGNDVQGAADERAPLRAEPNPYSRSKVAGEQLVQRLTRELRAPLTIVRPGWIYGPRDTNSFARLARQIEKRQLVMVGSGENHLPLIYARDAAQGLLLAAEAPRAEGRTYLLVNDEPVTQHEFVTAIAAELRAPPPARRMPYRLATSLGGLAEELARLTRTRPPVMRYGMQLLGGENRFVIARARNELGFDPEVTMAEGVRRSIEWYRATVEKRTVAVASA